MAGTAAVYFASDKQVVFASSEEHVKEVIELSTGKRKGGGGKLAKAISLAGGQTHVVGGFIIPGELAKIAKGPAVRQGMPNLGGLTDMQTGLLTIQVTGAKAEAELAGTYPSDAKAREAKDTLTGLKAFIPLAMMRLPLDPGWKTAIQKELNAITIDQAGPDVKAKWSGDFKSEHLGSIAKLLPRPGAVSNNVNINNQKQLNIAFNNYVNAHNNALPPASPQSPFSWRVEILPFIEQQDLYNRFHRNEPWNSPYNLDLAKTRMPKIYKLPGRKAQPGETFYKVFTGPKTLWDGPRIPTMPASFPKGTSNTILLVEAEQPVMWTKPEDLVLNDFPDPTTALHWTDGLATVCIADGSVRQIKRTILPLNLKNAIMPIKGAPGPLD